MGQTLATSTPARTPDEDLHWWADRLREWRDMGREVFVYFNNDGDGNAVRNATTLAHLVDS